MAAARRGPKAPPEEQELRLLFDAAVKVVARDGIDAVTLSSLLQEAGLGTRAFYRHFESKDQFLVATWLRQTQAASEALEAKMDGARRPIEAVEIWVDDFLDRLYSRDGTPHVEALWRNGFWLRNAYPNEFGSIVRVQLSALFRGLVDGSAKGEFPDTDPQFDASTILATCWMFAELGLRGDAIPREAARRHLLRVVRGLTGFVGLR
jgi:AcrR family transcriptional regulator